MDYVEKYRGQGCRGCRIIGHIGLILLCVHVSDMSEETLPWQDGADAARCRVEDGMELCHVPGQCMIKEFKLTHSLSDEGKSFLNSFRIRNILD
jgi:hypothetical protein